MCSAFLFRQDQPDFQDLFAFPEERQKPISLFEGVYLAIQTEQRSGMNVWQQHHPTALVMKALFLLWMDTS
jgi:hypothetical protein